MFAASLAFAATLLAAPQCSPDCRCWWKYEIKLSDPADIAGPNRDSGNHAYAWAQAVADLIIVEGSGRAASSDPQSPVAASCSTRTVSWRWLDTHEDPCTFCKVHGTKSDWMARAGFGIEARRKWNATAGAAGYIEISVPEVDLHCIAEGGFKLTPTGTSNASATKAANGKISFQWSGAGGPGVGIEVDGGLSSSKGMSFDHGTEAAHATEEYSGLDFGSDRERHAWTVNIDTKAQTSVFANGMLVTPLKGESHVKMKTHNNLGNTGTKLTQLDYTLDCESCSHPFKRRHTRVYINEQGASKIAWYVD